MNSEVIQDGHIPQLVEHQNQFHTSPIPLHRLNVNTMEPANNYMQAIRDTPSMHSMNNNNPLGQSQQYLIATSHRATTNPRIEQSINGGMGSEEEGGLDSQNQEQRQRGFHVAQGPYPFQDFQNQAN